MFGDIKAILPSEKVKCMNHQEGGEHECIGSDIILVGLDIFVMGFPCQPFSVQNIGNYSRSTEEKFNDPRAVPFLKVSKALMSQGWGKPKVVILETSTASHSRVTAIRTAPR